MKLRGNFCNRTWTIVALTLSMFLFATPMFAASVVGVNAAKGSIKINEGTDAGFSKGSRVCFFDNSNKKILCGKVAKANKKMALVNVPKAKAGAIKKGMNASLDSGGGGKSEVIAEDAKAERASSKGDHRRNIKIGYVGSLLAPSTFNKLSYNAVPSGATTVDSLWKSSGTTSGSLIGFFGEFQMGIGKKMALALGLRLRMFQDVILDSDYDLSNTAKYAHIEQSASSTGFYGDLDVIRLPVGRVVAFSFTTGLDYDISTVSMTAVQKQDGTGDANPIATAKSSLSVISLRLGSHFSTLLVGGLGLMFGVNALVPVMEMGKSFSATVGDAQASKLSGKAEADDIATALGHKKASFGGEGVLAAFFAF